MRRELGLRRDVHSSRLRLEVESETVVIHYHDAELVTNIQKNAARKIQAACPADQEVCNPNVTGTRSQKNLWFIVECPNDTCPMDVPKSSDDVTTN